MPDTRLYRAVAIRLLETGNLGPGTELPERDVPPGYPLFLSGVFAVMGSGDVAAVRTVQCLLGALTLLPLFGLARRAYPEDWRIAVVAVLATSVHPVLVLWPAFVLTETLYTLVSLVFLWLLLVSLDRPKALTALGAGLAFGASLLVREVLVGFVLFVVAAAAWRFGSLPRLARHLLAFGLGAGLLLGPWTFRNFSSTGRIVPLTGRTASVLDAGSSRETPDPRRLRSPLDRARYADYHEMASVRSLLRDPAGYVWALLVRLEFTWLHPNGLQSLPGGVLRWLYRLGHLVVLLLAVTGFAEAFRSRRWRALVLAGVLIYTIVVHLFISTAVPRYSIPVLPLILLFATAGTLRLWDRSMASR